MTVEMPDLRNGSRSFRTAVSYNSETDTIGNDLISQLGAEDFAFILLFYGNRKLPADVVAAVGASYNAPIYGCSTAGELTPAGVSNGAVVAIGFLSKDFGVASCLFPDLANFSIRDAQQLVRQKRDEFVLTRDPNKAHCFALMLVDGLCYCEEQLVSAINYGLCDIPLVGGSAGDGMDFNETSIIYHNEVQKNSACVLLIESACPIHIFKCDSFAPTDVKFVVTKADPENRIVHELNAMPAAMAYAQAIGVTMEELDLLSFASHPLCVCFGGDCYVRSIREVYDDGSFSFYCAIDEGIVFTLSEVNDMVSGIKATFDNVRADLGQPQLVLGFDCLLRRMLSEVNQSKAQINELFKANKVIGFNTYGEQVHGMHLNQTFSGIAIG